MAQAAAAQAKPALGAKKPSMAANGANATSASSKVRVNQKNPAQKQVFSN